jgi:hypothetical protein
MLCNLGFFYRKIFKSKDDNKANYESNDKIHHLKTFDIKYLIVSNNFKKNKFLERNRK